MRLGADGAVCVADGKAMVEAEKDGGAGVTVPVRREVRRPGGGGEIGKFLKQKSPNQADNTRDSKKKQSPG